MGVRRTLIVCVSASLVGCLASTVPSEAVPTVEAEDDPQPESSPVEVDVPVERDPQAEARAHEAIQRRQLRGELLQSSALVHEVALEPGRFEFLVRTPDGGEARAVHNLFTSRPGRELELVVDDG